MESSTLVNGKIMKFMEMEFSLLTLESILDNLDEDWNIFMVEKSKKIKFMKDSFKMEEDGDKE